MRALITNDDGVSSRGIAVLTRVAVEAGLDVVVAAPHEERSGASAALSGLEDGGRLRSTRTVVDDLDVDAFAVHASPALIAFVASRGAFGPRPDVVLSGINHGPNTGSAVLHSGTVGAALTAVTHGIPGLAVSLAGVDASSLAAVSSRTGDPSADPGAARPAATSWDTAADVTARALRWFLDHLDPDRVINVNVPAVPPSDLRGIRAARLATFGAVQAEIGDRDDEFVTVRFDEIHTETDDDSDASLVEHGWATVTALRPPTAVTVDTSELADPADPVDTPD
ncbi:5'/3'-nucleotidase SurE [Rhodococcoides corynebacterioides]|uniref:5'-nucleotidase n=1 Tax=Rhodococcoides corynebacterioides TaxID=53972 RepID=A0ABS7P063_9NOCA|nr:5'/3'-nucleotidase SurE [Rhodococcus corynebacterioides]MBY6365768.1 5'/3'-nucleotidase SurE [Rhodococcus corynebacterioides]MBY6406499.1 5'/3'-nucleotidase SurE [Rhodococcus corynebacterioides]